MIRFVDDLKNYKPQNEYSFLVKNYFEDILLCGSKHFIENIDAKIKILEINQMLIPISFGNNYENQCFSASLLGMFAYLQDESQKNISNPFLGYFLQFFSKNISTIFKKFGTYKVIFINNFLLSTNFFPNLSREEIAEMKAFLIKNFPEYSIVFRSVNELEGQAIFDFEVEKFKKIIFRQVYVGYKNQFEKYKKIKEVKADKNLLKRSAFICDTSENFSEKDIEDIVSCYKNLYIQKYSHNNPIITKKFIKNILKNHIFKIGVLRNNNQEVIAAYGYYHAFNQVASPIFGYKNGQYYRHLTSFFFQEVAQKYEILNWSSGVGQFKMHRGNEMKIEYFCVYYKHLDYKNRLIWSIIAFLSRYIGESYFKKYII